MLPIPPFPRCSIHRALTVLLSLACLWAIWVLPVAHSPRALAQTPDQQAEAERLADACDRLSIESNHQQILDTCTKAIQVARVVGNREKEANALNILGNTYWLQGQYSEAVNYYEQSLQISRSISNRQGEAYSLNNLGTVYGSKGQYSKAVNYYEQSLQISRTIVDLQGESNTLKNLGKIFWSQNQAVEAINYFEQSIPIFRLLGDRQGEADVLNHMGIAYGAQGQYHKALDYFEQSLSIFQLLGDHQGEAHTLIGLGLSYESQNQYSKAINLYEKSLQIAQALDDRQGEVNALRSLGIAYFLQEQYIKAISYFEQSLPIFRLLGDQQEEANALNLLGNAYWTLGQYTKAIDNHQRSLDLFHLLGDRHGEADSLNNLGNAYGALGQGSKAISFYEQSLQVSRSIGDHRREANALSNIGNAYKVQNRYNQAGDHFKQALTIFQALNDQRGEASTLMGLGTVYRAQSLHAKAIDCLEQALHLFQLLGDRGGEANALGNLGNVHLSQGQYIEAIRYHEQSLHLAQAIGYRQGEAISLSNLGIALYSASRLSEAEPYLLESIKIIESLRIDLFDAEKLSLFEVLASPYRVLQQLFVTQERYDEALEIAERGRARAFVELLARRLAPEEAETVADSQIATPLTLEQIKQVARNQNATLVEYSIAADDRLYIWVVDPTGAITFRWVDLSTLDATLGDLVSQTNAATAQGQSDGGLSLLVQGTRGALGTVDAPRTADSDLPSPLPEIGPDDPRFDDGLQQLYHLLIDPIQDLLPTKPQDHVVFIPQGSLYLAPFAALQAPDGAYLIEHHTLRTAPSIQVLHFTRQQRQARQRAIKNALVVGNPTLDLPAAGQEARAIARVFRARPLLGRQATLSAVKARMPEADLIHLAAHAAPNVVGESYGGLINLAGADPQDSSLTASDILSMQLQAELVVLSGCNTGLSDIINSDGVVGLARSIMTAGASSVLMSLWQVPDAPTAYLMQRFYHYWHPTTSWRWSPLGLGTIGTLTCSGKALGWLRSWWWSALPRLHYPGWRWKVWRRRLGMQYQNGQRWLWVVRQQWLFSARAWRRQWRWRLSQLRRVQLHRVRWRSLAGAIQATMRQGLPAIAPRRFVVSLNSRWLLAAVVVGIAMVAITLQAVPAPPVGMDKAQALRQAMLTTMKTHPEPRDWAAFTLMGEAE